VLPAVELELPGQLKQVVLSTAMAVAEYLPASQFKHVLDTEDPTVSEYLPAPQSTQPPPPREYWPARQLEVAQTNILVDFGSKSVCVRWRKSSLQVGGFG
jgi:hypothetical protein